MLVSASDPSAVIKLSEKESRTTSEIWREGCVCQINPNKLGSHPATGRGNLPSDLHQVRRTEVRGSEGKCKKWFQLNYLRRPVGQAISIWFNQVTTQSSEPPTWVWHQNSLKRSWKVASKSAFVVTCSKAKLQSIRMQNCDTLTGIMPGHKGQRKMV